MRRIWLLALVLVLATACGRSTDGPQVASADGTARPSVTPSASRLDQLLKFSQCMREHGIPMSDPRVDGDNVREGVVEPGFDKNTTDVAIEACKQYRPAPEAGPDMALKQELSRKLARCMRDHGVEKFPDPAADGTTPVPADVSTHPPVNDAKRTCEAQMDAEWASRRPTPGAGR
jgi:hypothetical protein